VGYKKYGEIMDQFQKFVVARSYCKWRDDLGRRESWDECVNRYYNYFGDRFPEVSGDQWESIQKLTLDREVFPSMRALMTAGAAAEVDDTCLYNCSYLAIDSIKSFSDILYILCCGTGVGFSCEGREIDKLPAIPELERDITLTIEVGDSRRGWANAFEELLLALYRGLHPTWDTSLVRAKGSRLKTFGGRASGPEPLERLFKFVVSLFYSAEGRKLTSLEVHDIVCMVGEIVISGGVRRSALISLSDLDDREMAKAKSGPWWEKQGHRALSNNSAVYTSKPTLDRFMEEWSSLYDSRSGERGICNREAMDRIASKAGRTPCNWGTNPCSEIILRPKQFCNLTEVVIRPYDNLATLRGKVHAAAVLGTIQSACTRFTFLDPEWKTNCEDERLLGISFTGIYDNKLMSVPSDELTAILTELRELACSVNKDWAERLNIAPSKAITCCKPSGTTSCVAGTSSGIHPRYSPYYIRRVRIDSKNPLCIFMMDRGIPSEPCVNKPNDTVVFSFPIKAPEGSLTYEDYNAIDHLELWLTYQKHWCDHKPSVTINYTDSSFLGIGQWIWNNWDWVSGISFLPHTDHVYEQAPFEAITKEVWAEMVKLIPNNINWDELAQYEHEDTTTSSHSLACVGGSCEIVDILGEN
jgi:ribonucleoside-diphosphate reductase alpha chain